MQTENMSNEEVVALAEKENGGGINTFIPMTRRSLEGRTKKQVNTDAKIVKEIVFQYDVKKDPETAFTVFCKNRNRLSDRVYWLMLKTQWISHGSVELEPIFRMYFSKKRPFKYYLETPEEQKAREFLPETLKVYRAARNESDIGLSWTISKPFAEAYAETMGRIIIEREVKKSDIFAFFNRRGESEVLIL